MGSIRRILVSVREPQAGAVPAIRKAAQLARALGAHLELFHALTWPIYSDTDEDFIKLRDAYEKRALQRLQKLAERVRGAARGVLKVSVAAQWDFPAYEAIIRRARTIKADLIVADQHSGRRVAPLLLHFNDWELLRRSPMPVLLVKCRGNYDHPTILAAVDPTHSLDKPAQLDALILQTGAQIAAALRGTLHSVHARVPLTSPVHPAKPLDAEGAAALNRKQATAARLRYERLLNGYRIPKARRHLLNLPPGEAIEFAAAKTHSDIVALGAISRSGWQRLLIGNTAESLLDPLRCDLLVIKPPHFNARVPQHITGARLMSAVAITP